MALQAWLCQVWVTLEEWSLIESNSMLIGIGATSPHEGSKVLYMDACIYVLTR